MTNVDQNCHRSVISLPLVIYTIYTVLPARSSGVTNPIIQSLSLRVELWSLGLTFQNWEPFSFFSCSRFCLIVNWIPTWSCGINFRPTYWRYKSPSYEKPSISGLNIRVFVHYRRLVASEVLGRGLLVLDSIKSNRHVLSCLVLSKLVLSGNSSCN